MNPTADRYEGLSPAVAAAMRGEAYPCGRCGREIPAKVAATSTQSTPMWVQAQSQALDVFEHWSGSRHGWPIASAQKLIALLLYVSAHDRGQPVNTVPLSAARVRLLIEQPSLRRYLAATIATIDDPGASHANAALRHLYFHPQYEGWDSVDGKSAPDMSDPEDFFHHGLSVAVTMLDAVLLAERGGRVPDSGVQVVTPYSSELRPATVLAPLWKLHLPTDGNDAMIDLAQGPPAGYTVRVHGFMELDVDAAAVSDAPLHRSQEPPPGTPQ